MVKYITKKILYMIFTLWIILTATFFLMYTMPGDPTQASTKVLPEAVQKNLEEKWGLDKPVPEQYVIYLKNLLHGNMGESYKTPGLQANQVIAERFPASLRLGLQAVVVSLILGLILGILAAFNRGRWIDFVTIFIAIIGVSVPSFVFAALLQKYGAGGLFPDCWMGNGRNEYSGNLPIYSFTDIGSIHWRYCNLFPFHEIISFGCSRSRLYSSC